MTEWEKVHLANKIGDIMDDAKPRGEIDEEKVSKPSININSQSDNRIACRDFFEVNIHIYDRARRGCETEKGAASDEQEPDVEVHTIPIRVSL